MIINGETTLCPYFRFLGVIPAITGKIELVYEGELEGPGKVANILIGKAIKTLLLQFFPDPEKPKKQKHQTLMPHSLTGLAMATTWPWLMICHYRIIKKPERGTGLKDVVKKFHPRLSENQQLLLMEFVLHGLAEFSQLNKGF
jgi:magnesium chelatase subunit I